MFDKKEYRKRREQGLRGQGDAPVTQQIAKWTEEDYKAGKCGKKAIGSDRTSDVTMHMTKKGLVAVTRKMTRQHVVDRTFTRRNYKYGRKIGSKLYNIIMQKQKKAIGTEFGKVIETEIDGKVVRRKYSFPAKSRHLRSQTEEQRRHLEKNPLHHNPDETNHERVLRQRKARHEADNAGRTATSAA